jgi:hypothetical protein
MRRGPGKRDPEIGAGGAGGTGGTGGTGGAASAVKTGDHAGAEKRRWKVPGVPHNRNFILLCLSSPRLRWRGVACAACAPLRAPHCPVRCRCGYNNGIFKNMNYYRI